MYTNLNQIFEKRNIDQKDIQIVRMKSALQGSRCA